MKVIKIINNIILLLFPLCHLAIKTCALDYFPIKIMISSSLDYSAIKVYPLECICMNITPLVKMHDTIDLSSLNTKL